ncbi:MAG TPA: hypothetical protein VHV09_08165 [Trebonia sp.]|nr:hypothetical protein [Trebonia sp.]
MTSAAAHSRYSRCPASDCGPGPSGGMFVQVTPARSRSAISSITCPVLVSSGGLSRSRWSGPISVGTACMAISKSASRAANPSQRRASARNQGRSAGPESHGPVPPWAPDGAQPSASRAARRRAKTDRPPTNSGGCGLRTGLGSNTMSAKSVNSPWNSGSSAVQRTFIARMYSSVIRPRRRKSTPSALNSPAAMPVPNVTMTRPPDSTSRVATALARRTGLCSGRMITPLFTAMRVVAPAMKAITVNASGQRPPICPASSRGRTTCSGTLTESKPSRSAAAAIRWKSAGARCSCQFAPGTAKLAGGHRDRPGRLVQNFTATPSPRPLPPHSELGVV